MEHKVDFLMKRYTSVCPDVRSRVNAATSELFDVTSDVYEFTSLHVIDNMGQAIATGPGPGLPAPFRAAATYFQIELRLVPRLCSLQTDIGIDPTKFPPSSNRAVYVPVPRVQNQMDVSITRQMVMDQAHHKEIIAAMAALGEEFSMRAATRDGEPDTKSGPSNRSQRPNSKRSNKHSQPPTLDYNREWRRQTNNWQNST
ncbi:unnamed protein product [Cylindrotheca closterium]|uniref:Uncharacterized protein n=1 Tax=Cylindrotheca closterium TaxID=2856 RepID=A0AAD2CFG1_9STRA|nr:unnamed protein product [Cylindrotheca closterium]